MAPRARTTPRCQNCRRKRIKCDYKEPSCGRCLRSGIRCEGYEQSLIFVPYTADTGAGSAAGTASRPEAGGSGSGSWSGTGSGTGSRARVTGPHGSRSNSSSSASSGFVNADASSYAHGNVSPVGQVGSSPDGYVNISPNTPINTSTNTNTTNTHINIQPQTRTTTNITIQTQTQPQTQPLTQPQTQPQTLALAQPHLQHPQTSPQTSPHSTHFLPSLPPTPPQGTINRQTLLSIFTANYLPTSPQPSSHSLHWLSHISSSQTAHRPLDLATNALGTTVLGRLHGDKALVQEGMEMYGRALRELRGWYAGRLEGRRWYGALMTTMVLQIYETVESSVQKGAGWIHHALGISMLLKAAGPEAFQHAPLHMCFLCCRLSLIIGSIAYEQSVFLAAPRWCSIPWNKTPKDEMHSLCDTLVLLPSLLEASNRFVSSAATPSEQKPAELDQFYALRRHIIAALENWHDVALVKRQGQWWASEPALEPVNEPFKEWLRFADLMDGQGLIFYWQAKLLCHEAVGRVRKASPSPADIEMADAEDNSLDELIETADRICQATPFQQTQDRGILGMHFSVLPVRTATVFYTQHGMLDKAAWCRRNIMQLTKRNFSSPSQMAFEED